MALRMRTLRGPASYLTGGATIFTFGDVERLTLSSGATGKKISAYTASSSTFMPNVVSQSNNAVAVILHDLRSGGQEIASATDISLVDIVFVYEGI